MKYEEHIRDKKCRAKVCQALRVSLINPEILQGLRKKCAKNCPVGAITGVRKECYHIDRISVSSVAPAEELCIEAIYIEA